MYTVKEPPKENNDKEKKKKKITIIVVISSILVVILIALLVILLILRNQQNPTTNNKVKYQATYDTTLVTDTTSLDNKGVTFTVTSGDNKYDVSVKLSTTTSNADIGSYIEHNYMYSIYDGHPNILDMSLTVKDKENNNKNITNNISDITYSLYLGDKDDYSILVLEKDASTYSSDNLISIYKLDVEFYIG